MPQEFLPKIGRPEAFSGRRFNPVPISQQNADGYNMIGSAFISAGQAIGDIAERRRAQDEAVFQVKATEVADVAYADFMSAYKKDPLREEPGQAASAYRDYLFKALQDEANTPGKVAILNKLSSREYSRYYGEATHHNNQARSVVALEAFDLHMNKQKFPADREAIAVFGEASAKELGVPNTPEALSWRQGRYDDAFIKTLLFPENLVKTLEAFNKGEEGALLDQIRDPGKKETFRKKAGELLNGIQSSARASFDKLKNAAQNLPKSKKAHPNDFQKIHQQAVETLHDLKPYMSLFPEDVKSDYQSLLQLTDMGAKTSIHGEDYLKLQTNQMGIPTRDVVELFSKNQEVLDTLFAAGELPFKDYYLGTAWNSVSRKYEAMKDKPADQLGMMMGLPSQQANAVFNGPGTREYQKAEITEHLGSVTLDDAMKMPPDQRKAFLQMAAGTLSFDQWLVWTGLNPVYGAMAQIAFLPTNDRPEDAVAFIQMARNETVSLSPGIDASGKENWENSSEYRNAWRYAHTVATFLPLHLGEGYDNLSFAEGKMANNLTNLIINSAYLLFSQEERSRGPIPMERVLQRIPDALERLNIGLVPYGDGKVMVLSGPSNRTTDTIVKSAYPTIVAEVLNHALSNPNSPVGVLLNTTAFTPGARMAAARTLYDRLHLVQERDGSIGVWYDTRQGDLAHTGITFNDEQMVSMASFTEKYIVSGEDTNASVSPTFYLGQAVGRMLFGDWKNAATPTEVEARRAALPYGEYEETEEQQKLREFILSRLEDKDIFGNRVVDPGRFAEAYIEARGVPGFKEMSEAWSRPFEKQLREGHRSIVNHPEKGFLEGQEALAIGVIQRPYPGDSFIEQGDENVASMPYGAYGLNANGEVVWAYTSIDSNVVRAREKAGILSAPREGYPVISGFPNNIKLGPRDVSHIISHRIASLFGLDAASFSGATINVTGQFAVVNRGSWFEVEKLIWDIARSRPDLRIDMMIGIRKGKRTIGFRVVNTADPEQSAEYQFLEVPDNSLGLSVHDQIKTRTFQEFRASLPPEHQHYADRLFLEQATNTAQGLLSLSENMEIDEVEDEVLSR